MAAGVLVKVRVIYRLRAVGTIPAGIIAEGIHSYDTGADPLILKLSPPILPQYSERQHSERAEQNSGRIFIFAQKVIDYFLQI